ncbi:hypothetical protein [Sphingosinicella terrae]|nr:hypothetical protein [Sphingosinicella terrae]
MVFDLIGEFLAQLIPARAQGWLLALSALLALALILWWLLEPAAS